MHSYTEGYEDDYFEGIDDDEFMEKFLKDKSMIEDFDIKDFDLELKLKKLLSESGLYYTTSDTTLEEKRTHITYFIITVGG